MEDNDKKIKTNNLAEVYYYVGKHAVLRKEIEFTNLEKRIAEI